MRKIRIISSLFIISQTVVWVNLNARKHKVTNKTQNVISVKVHTDGVFGNSIGWRDIKPGKTITLNVVEDCTKGFEVIYGPEKKAKVSMPKQCQALKVNIHPYIANASSQFVMIRIPKLEGKVYRLTEVHPKTIYTGGQMPDEKRAQQLLDDGFITPDHAYLQPNKPETVILGKLTVPKNLPKDSPYKIGNTGLYVNKGSTSIPKISAAIPMLIQLMEDSNTLTFKPSSDHYPTATLTLKKTKEVHNIILTSSVASMKKKETLEFNQFIDYLMKKHSTLYLKKSDKKGNQYLFYSGRPCMLYLDIAIGWKGAYFEKLRLRVPYARFQSEYAKPQKDGWFPYKHDWLKKNNILFVKQQYKNKAI